jgi:hemerythrin-like domain-containing protein
MNPQSHSPLSSEPQVSALLAIEQALSSSETSLSPLDRLVAMRLALQAFCAIVRSLSTVSPELFRAMAPGLAQFLAQDFVRIVTEEQDGLLVYLRRRLMLGDELDALIGHLHDEHRQDCEQARILSGRCGEFASGIETDWPDLLEALSAFAEQQRRHLIWEDATILPVARERLQADDLQNWSADMTRRHQLVRCDTH